MFDSDAAFVDALQAELGGALRTVAEYDETDYAILFMREDVRATYEDADVQDIHENVVLDSISAEFLESLFDAGSLTCSLQLFDDAAMCSFPREDYDGLFVSFDAGADVSLLSLRRTCERWADDAE